MIAGKTAGRAARTAALLLLFLLLGANLCTARADEEADGQRAYTRGDYAAALHTWRKLAESGNRQAERDMGMLYETGHGVRRDIARALHWYKRAGINGDAQAMYDVGRIYGDGRGVPVDAGRAAWWYRKAAQHGSGPAAYALALMYQRGDGVPKSHADAEHYFRVAADHGVTAARNGQEKAQEMAQNRAEQLPLPPKPVPPPVTAAAPPIDPALARAQTLILARGVVRIDAQAIAALRTAAAHGDAVAQYDLGFCYQNGFGVPADRTQAYVWYRRAGNASAPAAIHDAAATQTRTLEAQLEPSQLDAAKALLHAPQK